MRKQENQRVSNTNTLLQNKRFVMVLSLLLAIIVWVMFAVIEGEEQENTIRVLVQFSLEGTAAERRGWHYFYDSPETNPRNLYVDVTVVSMRYEQIRPEDIRARLIATRVTEVGEDWLEIQVEPEHGRFEIRSFSIVGHPEDNDQVPLFFDHFSENTFDIALEVRGEVNVPEGYFAADPLLLQQRVHVSGPQNVVRQIASVHAVLNINEELTETTSFEQLELIARNHDGAVLRYHRYLTFEEGNPQITAEIPVWPVFDDLATAAAFINMPGAYQNNGLQYTITPARVQAALPAAGVFNGSTFFVGEIHARELSPQTNRFTFAARDLSEVHFFTDIEYFEVEVDMQGFEQRQFTLPAGQIRLPANGMFSAAFRDVPGITVVGPAHILSELTAEDLTAVAVLNDDMEPGTQMQMLPLNITVNSDSVWVFDTHQVQAILRESVE